MWCISCGTKLPENAKFCFQCGTNLSEILKNHLKKEINIEPGETEEFDVVEENANTDNVPLCDDDVEEDIIISLSDRTLKLPYLAQQYAFLEKSLNTFATAARSSFWESYNSNFRDFEGMITFSKENSFAYYQMTTEVIDKFGGLFGYSEFKSAFDEHFEPSSLRFFTKICRFEKDYDDVMRQVAEEEQRREARSASRGRWQGGGFGVKGAIKGAVTASAMNAASGAIHSIVNGVGNASTRAKVESEFNKVYQDKDLIEELANMLYSDIMYMKETIIKVVELEYGKKIPVIYSEEDHDESEKLYNALISGVISDDEVSDRVLDMLIAYPFHEKYYICALTLIPEIHGVEQYAKYFNVLYGHVEKEVENRKELKKSLGNAVHKFEDKLSDNVFYKKLKCEYTQDLVCNIEASLALNDIQDVNYIYKVIDNPTLDKFFEAFENYADFNGEVPILFYDELSDGKDSEGIVLTNKNIYFTDNRCDSIKISLEDIEKINHGEDELIVNGTRMQIKKMDSEDINGFAQLITYLVTIIANSKLSGIETGNEIPDILKLRYFYYGNGAELDKAFGQAKEMMDTKLDKNRFYHQIKGGMRGDLAFDFNLILENRNWDRVWYIYNSIEDKIRTKLDKAVNSYAKINGETPILIHDSTTFGGAKEGFVITDEAIYGKELRGDAFRLAFADINKAEFFDDKFILNDVEIGFKAIHSTDRKFFAKVLMVLVYRLMAEKYFPGEIRVRVKNKLLLNRNFNYHVQNIQYQGLALGNDPGAVQTPNNANDASNMNAINSAESVGSEVVPQSKTSQILEEIKWNAKLLENGVITQEEFDKVKKHLLGM